MSKIIAPILAQVEHLTKTKEGNYGPYKSVLFLTSDGEKIWKSFDPDSPDLEVLTIGTKVRLIPTANKNGGSKPSHLVELVEAPAPTSAGLEAETKRAIAAYVEEQAALYGFCLASAEQVLGDSRSEETIRCAASTLYISAQRKFSL